MSLTYRQVMYISDDHSFDMAPDTHYHRVFPAENTNGTFTLPVTRQKNEISSLSPG
jgi:hypothetical protein